ncbi:hypothetical protein SprV_0200524400 [Sparganum proliferum]
MSSAAHVANIGTGAMKKTSPSATYSPRRNNCTKLTSIDPPTTKSASYCSRHLVQQRLREMLDVCTTWKSEETRGYADRDEWKNIFAAIMDANQSGHLVRKERLFYGDVATGSHRQGNQVRRYKDTLRTSLKHLQINVTNWEDLALDRLAWRRTGAASYEASHVVAAKAKCKTCISQRQHSARRSGRRRHQSASKDTFGRDAPTDRHRLILLLLLPLSFLPQTPRRPPHPSTPITVMLSRRHRSPTSLAVSQPLRRPSPPTVCEPPTSPATWTRFIPVLIAAAHSPHASVWSVACEPIAQRLANQCLEHQPTLAAFASTVHTAPAHSLTACVYSTTCASKRAELTAVSTQLTTLAHPPHPTHTPSPNVSIANSSTNATIR